MYLSSRHVSSLKLDVKAALPYWNQVGGGLMPIEIPLKGAGGDTGDRIKPAEAHACAHVPGRPLQIIFKGLIIAELVGVVPSQLVVTWPRDGRDDEAEGPVERADTHAGAYLQRMMVAVPMAPDALAGAATVLRIG